MASLSNRSIYIPKQRIVGLFMVFILTISLLPLTVYGAEDRGFFGTLWCSVKEVFGGSCTSTTTVITTPSTTINTPPKPMFKIKGEEVLGTSTEEEVVVEDTITTTVVPDTSLESRLSSVESRLNGIQPLSLTVNPVREVVKERSRGYDITLIPDQGTQQEVGTLNKGSISSTFGDINIGTNAFTGGTLTIDESTLVTDSTNNRVGIGTTSPTDTLSVSGPVYLENVTPGTTNNRLYANSGDLYWAGSLVGGSTVGTWTTDGTDVWRPTGNVGIGTSTPGAKLHSLATTEQLRLGYDASNYASFTTNSTGDLTIDPTGATTTIDGLVYQTGLGGSTFFGDQSGASDDLSSNVNTGFGYRSLKTNSTGVRNVAVGHSALRENTASDNTALGYATLILNTTGLRNDASGTWTMYANTTGSYNTASGYRALTANTTGNNNVAYGHEALLNNTTGGNNIGIGYRSGDNITTGSSNLILGHNIDAQSATANNQLSIGNLIFGTGLDGTGTSISSGNIGIGTTTPAAKLDVYGELALRNSDGSAVLGDTTGDTRGLDSIDLQVVRFDSDRVASGLRASAFGVGNKSTSTESSAIGAFNQAVAYTASAFGWLNVASDQYASAFGNFNTASGYASSVFGQNNTASGLNSLSLGKGNTASGTRAGAIGYGNTASATDSYAFGKSITNGTANSVMIGPSDSSKITILSTGLAGIGTTTPGATLHALDTTEQLRLGYDSSNYASFTVDSTGGLTIDPIGGTTTISGLVYQTDLGNSTYFGNNAGANDDLSSNSNTGFGNNALRFNTTAAANTAVGANAMYNNTTGGSNVAIGYQAMQSNTTGASNVAVGVGALLSNETGTTNTAVGRDALRSTTGIGNTALGYNALKNTTSGNYNLGLGSSALSVNTTGSYNVAGGYNALSSNTSGGWNTAFGNLSSRFNTTGSYNFSAGSYALYDNVTGSGNVAIGGNALRYNATSSNNIAIGYNAGKGSNGVTESSYNIFLGHSSGYSNTTGSNNLAMGRFTAYSVTSGANNVFLGYQSGSNVTTGSNNLLIGYDVDAASTTASNQMSIGNLIFSEGIDGTGTTISTGNIGIGTTSPQQRLHVYRSDDGAPIRVEDSNGYCEIDPTTTTWSCTSDERLKDNIKVINASTTLDKLLKLEPSTFTWIKDNTNTERTGLIAQDVEKVFPDLVKTDRDTGYKSVSYGGFTTYIISAIQELKNQIGSIKNSAMAWGSDVIGELDSLFTRKIVVREELCFDNVCISKSEFKQLLENAGVDGKKYYNGHTDPPSEDNDSNATTSESTTATSTDENSIDDDTATSTEDVKEDNTSTSTEEVVDEETEETSPVQEEGSGSTQEETPTEEIIEPIIEEEAPEESIEENTISTEDDSTKDPEPEISETPVGEE